MKIIWQYLPRYRPSVLFVIPIKTIRGESQYFNLNTAKLRTRIITDKKQSWENKKKDKLLTYLLFCLCGDSNDTLS